MSEKNRTGKNDQRKQESQNYRNTKSGQEQQSNKSENGCNSDQNTGR